MELKSLYTNQVVPLQNQLKIRQERAEELRRMHDTIKNFIPVLLNIDAPEILQAMTITYNSLRKKLRQNAES